MPGSHVFPFINSVCLICLQKNEYIFFMQGFISIFCHRVRVKVYSLHKYVLIWILHWGYEYMIFNTIFFICTSFCDCKIHCKRRSMNCKQIEIYIAFILVVKYKINWIYNHMRNTDISPFLCFCRTTLQIQAVLFVLQHYICF